MTMRRARLAASIALAALSVVAASSLGRVLDSSRFLLPVVGAALVPHALGALRRWRGWSAWLGVALALGGLVVYVVLALEASTTTAGLPGADTWHAVETQLSGGWHLLRTAPAPAPATDGAILLAVVAVWCMAAFADWLAFTRHTALAATSPALVFFVWTSTLGTDDLQLALTAAFCACAAAFVLAQHLALLDQRRSWLVSRHGARPHWLVPAVLLGGGAIVVALLVAPIMPGSGADPVLDVGNGRRGSGGRSYRPAVTPFVDIGRKLDVPDDVELFTVRSSLPDYWRIAALDSYSSDNGGEWTLSAEGEGGVELGLPTAAPAGALEQHFTIGRLGERWLPAAYEPVAIDLADTLVVKSSGTLVADADQVTNLRYTVASKLPPLAGTPISAEQIAATAAPMPSDLRRDLELPKTDDIADITAHARAIATDAGATTPYARAAALRDYFRDPTNGFAYDTNVGFDDSGASILQFLSDKRGYCVQFASAYAVMARALGIPARVAVGFTSGELGVDGRYHVTSHDAHAWPEVYLHGLGWTHLFDPTPSTANTAVGGSALPGDTAAGSATAPTLPPATTPPATATTLGGGTGAGTGTQPPGTATTPATAAPTPRHASSSAAPWLTVVAVVAIVVLTIGSYVAAVLLLKRQRRNRRQNIQNPTRAVIGAWLEALDQLREADVVARPAQTPLDLAATVPSLTTLATTPAMRELARTYSAARYGDGAIGDDDVRTAWSSVDALQRALDDDEPWSRRWRRRIDARTLLFPRRSRPLAPSQRAGRA